MAWTSSPVCNTKPQAQQSALRHGSELFAGRVEGGLRAWGSWVFSVAPMERGEGLQGLECWAKAICREGKLCECYVKAGTREAWLSLKKPRLLMRQTLLVGLFSHVRENLSCGLA